jgi:hypothetical protein
MKEQEERSKRIEKLELKSQLIDKIEEKEMKYLQLKSEADQDKKFRLEREYRALDKEVIDLINALGN